MPKIKNFLSKMSEEYKENLKKYMEFHVVVILTTLIAMFWNYNNESDIIFKIILIGTISAINLFTNINLFKKKSHIIVGDIASIGIAITFERLINYYDYSETIIRITIGYSIIMFLIGLIKTIKDSKLSFHEYVIKTFQNLFNTNIIYLILNIGLTIILSVLVLLLIEHANVFELILRLQIALLGLYLVPACLISITTKKTEISKFISGLVQFVLLPLALIMMLIIYLYMAKIFIAQEIPKNIIFRIILGLFIALFPIEIMAYNFKEKNKFIEKTSKIIPYLFMPFIGIQIYSISVRCIENGITPIRYVGIMLIIFESISVILAIYKNRKYIKNVITVGIVIIAILTICPVINMETISNISQSKRLKNAWNEGSSFENLSEEQKEIAKSSYEYLKGKKDKEKYIPSYIDENKFKDLSENKYKYHNNYVHYKFNDENIIDITEYAYFKTLNISYYGTQYSESRLNPELVEKIKEYVLKVVEEDKIESELSKNYIKNNQIIKVSNYLDLYLNNIDITYNMDENNKVEILNLKLNAYMLIR